jgi:energy-coupling factor transporter transmembrane protein EcfT
VAAVAFGYHHAETLLHDLDARVKLAAMVLFSMASLRVGGAALVLALLVAMLLLCHVRLPLMRWLFSLRWYAVLLAAIVVVRSLTMPGEPLFDIPRMPLSRQGADEGLLLAGRLLVVTLFGLLLTATTRPSQIRSAVEWYLRPVPFIPHRQAATMIGLLVRFIPVILTQATEQGDALRARAIDNRRNPLRRITFLCMPLLRRTFVTADRLALAMEARCYGDRRTVQPWRMAARDWTALAIAGGLCLLMLAVG